MYCVYTYGAGATKGNILADVVKLLTGTTDITQLAAQVISNTTANVTFTSGVGSGFSGLTPSALVGLYVHHNGAQRGKVTANDATTVTISDLTYTDASAYTCYISTFEIYTSWATAGWTVFDASAGTNAQCLYAPNHASFAPTAYKYVTLDTNTTGFILQKTYELWNSETHAGTNLCYASDATATNQQINTTSGGSIYISSSARHLWMISYQASTWGSSTGNGSSGVFERVGMHPQDTVANAYPPYVWVNLNRVLAAGAAGNPNASHPRLLKADGTDGTGTNAATMTITPIFGAVTTITSQLPIGSAKSLLYPFFPMIVLHSTNYWGGDISTYSNIYYTNYAVITALTERIESGNTYVIIPETGSYHSVVRKG